MSLHLPRPHPTLLPPPSPLSKFGLHGMTFARVGVALALVATLAAGCATDPLRDRANVIKDRVKAFHDHLYADRVRAAILENERIEALAAFIEADVVRRGRPMADNRLDKDWLAAKTAREAAAENWLTLGRYLALKNRAEEARAAYRRLLSTYSTADYRAQQEQATGGLQDLEIMSPAAR